MAQTYAKASGAWHALTAVYAKVSGSWTAVNTVYAKVSGSWTPVWSGAGGALSASMSGDATGFNSPGTPATTNAVTLTAAGGTAPYTYAWTHISGDTLTVGSATNKTTTFTDNGSDKVAVYRCTVTDALGATAYDETNVTTGH